MQLFLTDFGDVLAVGVFECHPHGQSQKVAERHCRLVQRSAQIGRHVGCDGRLRAFESLQARIELHASVLIVSQTGRMAERLTHTKRSLARGTMQRGRI